ncbi:MULTISPECIES: immunity 22 family protein [Comamonadaceae]|uniref:Immunity protein 22 n=1 Tax=Paracidovorax konjaci TaxID=32040 RepID=A0A1I1WCT1_9BURK|nr:MULTISPECIES: immunity 22 family protein [Comamonadaceae]MDA8520884.1 immunity 22 family protein [Acidovorax sp. NCPPB 4044]SFD92188.1 Immunity protein 22 [Paracidovorax konjaci]
MLNDNTPGIISVWMGTTHQSLEEFNAYLEGLDEHQSGSPIQADLGADFIDTDFFVAYGTEDNRTVPVEELVKEVDCSLDLEPRIVKACYAKGLTEGNSLFYYKNATFEEPEPGRRYNGLLFIGSFAD